MATPSMLAMWEAMAKYPIVVVGEGQYPCSICHKLMVDAHISRCGCQFCKACIDEHLANGGVNCPGGKLECQEEPFNLHSNVFPDNSANIKISRLNVVCPISQCGSVIELGKLVEHLRICDVAVINCPYSRIGCAYNEDELGNHMESDKLAHANLLVDEVENLRNELDLMKDKLDSKEMDILKLKQYIDDRLNGRSSRDALELEGSQRRNQPLRGLQSRNLEVKGLHGGGMQVGEMVWCYDDFSTKFQMALEKSKTSDHSESFVSHVNGYMFCLVIYPYGCSDGRGKDLYVGFNVMKGPFDDRLKWPFKGTVTIAIVDQVSGLDTFVRRYSYDSVPHEFRYLFDKPKTYRNHGYGDLHLIKLSELMEGSSLLMNDQLLLRGSIELFYDY